MKKIWADRLTTIFAQQGHEIGKLVSDEIADTGNLKVSVRILRQDLRFRRVRSAVGLANLLHSNAMRAASR
jgi:hypothetical protein